MKKLLIVLVLMWVLPALTTAQDTRDEVDAYQDLFHRKVFDRPDGTRMQCPEQRPVMQLAIVRFLHQPRLQVILDEAMQEDGWRPSRSLSAQRNSITAQVARMMVEYDVLEASEEKVRKGGFTSTCPKRNEIRTAAGIVGAHLKEHLVDAPDPIGKVAVTGNVLFRWTVQHPLAVAPEN